MLRRQNGLQVQHPYLLFMIRSLSEDEIKSAFLPFLREFYRFRYEYQAHTEQSSLDNVTADGLIADGMLRFQKPDGKPFVCTYEATSADKEGEVKFTLHQTYFLWDCVAFGMFVAAAAMGFFYVFDLPFLGKLSVPGKIGMPLGLALIGFFIWYFFMSGWKKYRHIFSIEQFRRYHADEQWIALSEDVFPAPTSPYYLELKEQCIYHGIGLAIVHADRQVRMVAAPSRLGVLGGKRRMAHWITDTHLYQSMSSNIKAAAAYQTPVAGPVAQVRNTLMRPVRRYLLQPLQNALGKTVQPLATDAYKQFTEDYLVQKWLSVLFLTIIVIVAVKSVEKKPYNEAERLPRIYQPEAPVKSPEKQDGYVMNDREEAVPFGQTYRTGQPLGVPRQEAVDADYASAEPAPGYQANAPATTSAKAPSSRPAVPADTTRRTAAAPSAAKTSPPRTSAPPAAAGSLCERIKKAGGWYIQDNLFAAKSNAVERVNALRGKGINCDLFDATCLGEKGWVVRLGYNEYSLAAARQKAADYQKLIAQKGLKTGKALVKKVGGG